MYPDVYIPLYSNSFDLGGAVSSLTGSYLGKLTCAVVDISRRDDGFLGGVYTNSTHSEIKTILIDKNDSLSTLFVKLHRLQELNCKLILVHIAIYQLQELFSIAKMLDLVNEGYAWIVIDLNLDISQINSLDLPDGLLVVRKNTDVNILTSILQRTYVFLNYAISHYQNISTSSTISSPSSFNTYIYSLYRWVNIYESCVDVRVVQCSSSVLLYYLWVNLDIIPVIG